MARYPDGADLTGVDGAEHLHARRMALSRVFRALGVRWPKIFDQRRTDELMPIWLQACGGVDVGVLEPAAVDYAATSTGAYAPTPPEFAAHARGFERRLTPRPFTPHVDRRPDPMQQARAFWFERAGEPKGAGRLDAAHAIAWALPSGASIGISDPEMDAVYDGRTRWGWLDVTELPECAAPETWGSP